MTKSEIEARVEELLSSGTPKADVYFALSGQGIKDRQLAYMIAAFPDIGRCAEHSGKVNVVVTLMFIQALVVFLVGFAMGMRIGPTSKWLIGLLVAFVPLLFAWGFHTHRVWAYNAYIVLSIIQFPQALSDFGSSPIASSIGLALGLAMLGFVWYVREKIFPGFAFVSPRKRNGEYAFVD